VVVVDMAVEVADMAVDVGAAATEADRVDMAAVEDMVSNSRVDMAAVDTADTKQSPPSPRRNSAKTISLFFLHNIS